MREVNEKKYADNYYCNFIWDYYFIYGFFIKYDPFSVNQTGYLLDKEVPGIVKGTAKMVDTEAYFTKYDLQESSVRLDFICNNSNNLRIALGYKSPTSALMLADYPTKEIVIWSGEDNFPESSSYYKSKNEEVVSRITREWDLLSIGFTEDEYVKADERIWYLRINELISGTYGYEKNVTEVIDGTEYLVPEFIPNIHYIEEFKIVFNQLIFETMLYPFFDGSKEIIIPIRGVSHELVIEDPKTDLEIRGMTIKASTWSTTTPPIGAGNMWTLVFGTSDYRALVGEDLPYSPMECRCFILGCVEPLGLDYFEAGVFDYGWRVAYCMDGDSTQTDIATTTQTDDDFCEDMFDFVDGKFGSTGKLIVFVVGHGGEDDGEHFTTTGKTRRIGGFTNSIELEEYEDKVNDITTDGTHILLYICSCHGDGLDSFSPSDHNYCLESWSFRPLHFGRPSTGYISGSTFADFYWCYYNDSGNPILQSEPAWIFYYTAIGTCEYTVTEIGEMAQIQYNQYYTPEGRMYIQSTWSSYYFYINWGY